MLSEISMLYSGVIMICMSVLSLGGTFFYLAKRLKNIDYREN